jgi:hypothetical protein
MVIQNVKFSQQWTLQRRKLTYIVLSHSTCSVSVTKTSQLMLYKEIITVCSETHTKHINTLCGQNVEIFKLNVVKSVVTAVLWGVKIFFWGLMPYCVVHGFLCIKPYSGTSLMTVILTHGRDLLVVGTGVKRKAGKRGITVHAPPGNFCPLQSINMNVLGKRVYVLRRFQGEASSGQLCWHSVSKLS